MILFGRDLYFRVDVQERSGEFWSVAVISLLDVVVQMRVFFVLCICVNPQLELWLGWTLCHLILHHGACV